MSVMGEKELKEVVLSLRVEESLRDELRALADKAERPFSDEHRRALRLYVLSQRDAT